MLKALTTLIIVLLLSTASASVCHPFTGMNLLQTGVVTFASTSQSRLNCLDVPITYNVFPTGFKSVTSLVQFGTYPVVVEGLEYSVMGRPKNGSTTTLTITLLMSGVWKNIGVSYLVSSRTDTSIGSLAIDGSSTFDQSGNSLTNISSTANIWPWSPLTQSQTAYQTAVISGVRCGPVVPPITLNLLLDPVGGRVTVYILLPSNSSVEYVQVQYFIIFAFPSNFFAISKETGVVGTGDLNFQFLSKLAGPTVGVSTMVVFKNKQVCVGASCPSLYTTPAACTALSGVQVQQLCVICEPGQIYSANGGCTCPYNQYSYMGSCTPCWNNSSPSADLTTCTCLTGFTAQGTSCISDDKCPPGATWNPYNSSCFCVIPGQIYSGFGCTCGYYFVLNPKHECVCSSSTDNDCSCAGNYYYAPGIGCAPVLKLTQESDTNQGSLSSTFSPSASLHFGRSATSSYKKIHGHHPEHKDISYHPEHKGDTTNHTEQKGQTPQHTESKGNAPHHLEDKSETVPHTEQKSQTLHHTEQKSQPLHNTAQKSQTSHSTDHPSPIPHSPDPIHPTPLHPEGKSTTTILETKDTSAHSEKHKDTDFHNHQSHIEDSHIIHTGNGHPHNVQPATTSLSSQTTSAPSAKLGASHPQPHDSHKTTQQTNKNVGQPKGKHK